MGSNSNSTVIGFGPDWGIVAASRSQRAQGAVAFLRSSALTVNGSPAKGTAVRFGFRLNAAQSAALIAARPAEGKPGKVTLPLVKRGRPVGQSVGLSGLAALVAPTAAKTARKAPRKATPAPSATTDASAS